MSSPYAILDNRPIDKWKVTELKEELKKRRLVTRGLKEDLVKRLDEAVRQEQEETERLNRAAAEEANQATDMTPITGDVTPDRKQATPNSAAVSTQTPPSAAQTPPSAAETTPSAAETTPASTAANTTPESATVKSMTASAAVETTPPPVQQAKLQDEKVDDGRDIAGVDSSVVDVKLQEPQELDVKDAEESGVTATGTAGAEEASSEHILNKSDVEMENKKSITDLDDGDSKVQPENEGAKAQPTDDKSATYNQVSQVSPVAGFEVKSDCISTDSVSNNEKIELKDNEIADNVKLEQNVNKSQEPSAVGGESHPMDVEEPLEQKIFVGGGNDSNAANADMNKGNNIVDAGDSEKLNLDRSSGDDSMEDEPEAKQTESNTFDEVVDKSEETKMPIDKEESRDEVMGNDSVAGIGEAPENKSQQAVAPEKRKLPVNDQEAVENNEPAKRQRRWNSESIKVPEAQTKNTAPTTTPRSTGLKRDFSRSDSSLSEDGPKERVVPPSPKEPTNSLRIDRFLRPFTLKAVQELLGKTGNVTSFWMDHIKTHCYVSYSSVEEAAATREAVYNLQWPPNGGRLLVAEFVGPEEVKAKLEAPLLPATTPAVPSQAPSQPQISMVQPQLPPPPTALPPPPPLAKLPPPVRERLPPPPPIVSEEQEPPIVTLDDLFKKTKAIPRIYYLPLSDEQVAAKLASRGNSKTTSNNK